jgi:hypothetical protein
VPAPDLKQLAAYINAEHGAAMQAGVIGLNSLEIARQHMASAGKALLEVKEKIGPRGGLVEWMAENLSFTPRAAQYYMRLARGELPRPKANRCSFTTPEKLIAHATYEPEDEEPESPHEDSEPAAEEEPEGQSNLFAEEQEEGEPPSEDNGSEQQEEEEEVPAPAPVPTHSNFVKRWLDLVQGPEHPGGGASA